MTVLASYLFFCNNTRVLGWFANHICSVDASFSLIFMETFWVACVKYLGFSLVVINTAASVYLHIVKIMSLVVIQLC